MIRLCIFDFDGTLCGTHDAIAVCIDATFDHYGVPRPGVKRREAVIETGVVMAEAMAILNADTPYERDAEQWATTYRALYREHGLAHSYLFDGVKDTLECLKAGGRTLVIASNKAPASVDIALAHYGLAPFIDLAVCDPQGVPKKPDPASYTQLIAPAFPGMKPADIVMVGDTAADLGFARNIGAYFAWASYGYGDPDAGLAAGSDAVLNTFAELPGIIGTLPAKPPRN
ncbi:HAD family hydrolase [Caballeronia sp. DA-9]|uniref:HAD family hydrolase n=1 Tax=Caballeronia sp. DA-9 TaxID=3436237 RepID=UPI003F67F6A1